MQEGSTATWTNTSPRSTPPGRADRYIGYAEEVVATHGDQPTAPGSASSSTTRCRPSFGETFVSHLRVAGDPHA